MYCMEFLEKNIEWLKSKLEEIQGMLASAGINGPIFRSKKMLILIVDRLLSDI